MGEMSSVVLFLSLEMPHNWKTLSLLLGFITSLLCNSILWLDNIKEKVIQVLTLKMYLVDVLN